MDEEFDLQAEQCPFVFSRAGQTVAVYYNDDYHIGSVTTVFSEDEAEVNFIKKSVVTKNTYTWLAAQDMDVVKSLFFSSDFRHNCQWQNVVCAILLQNE